MLRRFARTEFSLEIMLVEIPLSDVWSTWNNICAVVLLRIVCRDVAGPSHMREALMVLMSSLSTMRHNFRRGRGDRQQSIAESSPFIGLKQQFFAVTVALCLWL